MRILYGFIFSDAVHFVDDVSCVYEYFIYFNTISLTVHFFKPRNDASPKKTTAVLHTQLACIPYDMNFFQFVSLLKVGCMKNE